MEALVHIARSSVCPPGRWVVSVAASPWFPNSDNNAVEEHSSVSLPSVLHHSGTILHANPLRLSFCSETIWDGQPGYEANVIDTIYANMIMNYRM